jgi:hypothetical protein
MRLVATIDQRAVIDRILRHLGLATELPIPRPARVPPLGDVVRGDRFDGGTELSAFETRA